MTALDYVRSLIERGYYEEALEEIGRLDDKLDQLVALKEMISHIINHLGPIEWIPEILETMVDIAGDLKTPKERAIGYSVVSSAFKLSGYDQEAYEFIDAALKESSRVKDKVERGRILGDIGYELAVGGQAQDAMSAFDAAFDLIINAEVDYRTKADAVLYLADLLERAGDALFSGEALEFYRTAFDIFDKLGLSQRAGIIEKKLELSRNTMESGHPLVRKALFEGKYHYALALIERLYDGIPRVLGTLETANWMKRMEDPEYLDVINRAFESLKKVSLTEGGVERIARLLGKIGHTGKILQFVEILDDPRMRYIALKAAAVEMAKLEKLEEAEELLRMIGDRETRISALEEINAILKGGMK